MAYKMNNKTSNGTVTNNKKRKPRFRIPSVMEYVAKEGKFLAKTLTHAYQKYIRKDPRGKLTKK